MKTRLETMVERILETCETGLKGSASVLKQMRGVRSELEAALRGDLAAGRRSARVTLTPEKRRQVNLAKSRYRELCKKSAAVSLLAVARRTIEEARRSGRTEGYANPLSLRLQVQREILRDERAGLWASDA